MRIKYGMNVEDTPEINRGVPPNTTGYWNKAGEDFWKWLADEAAYYPLRFISVPIDSEIGRMVIESKGDVTICGEYVCKSEIDIVARLPDCLIGFEAGTELTVFSQPFEVLRDDDDNDEEVATSGPSALYFYHSYPYGKKGGVERPTDLVLPKGNTLVMAPKPDLSGHQPFTQKDNYRITQSRKRKPTKSEWADTNVAIMYPGDAVKIFGAGGDVMSFVSVFDAIPDSEKISEPVEDDE